MPDPGGLSALFPGMFPGMFLGVLLGVVLAAIAGAGLGRLRAFARVRPAAYAGTGPAFDLRRHLAAQTTLPAELVSVATDRGILSVSDVTSNLITNSLRFVN